MTSIIIIIDIIIRAPIRPPPAPGSDTLAAPAAPWFVAVSCRLNYGFLFR